jgi:hypothetical protein
MRGAERRQSRCEADPTVSLDHLQKIKYQRCKLQLTPTFALADGDRTSEGRREAGEAAETEFWQLGLSIIANASFGSFIRNPGPTARMAEKNKN